MPRHLLNTDYPSKHNLSAITAPTAGDDSGDGYSVGSIWVDTVTNAIYTCTDNSLGAAVWIENNEASSLSSSSGVLTGGVLQIGTGGAGVATTFSITDGSGQIVDSNGVRTPVSWINITDVAVTNIATNLITFVAIDSLGAVVQSTTRFTPQQSRTLIILGVVVHVNKTNVDAVNNEQHIAYNTMSSLYDGMEAINFFNVEGNVFSDNGATLQMNKSVGIMFKMGSNYDTDINNPHERTLAALSPVTFQYRFSNGDNGVTGTSVDPNNLDDGAGGLTSVGVNKWSVQRIYSFTSNNVKVQRGVADYSTSDLAIAAISTEAYITEPSIAANGLFRGWLVVQQGATDLSDPSEAVFLSAGKFGEGSSGGGAVSATDLQTAYNNSVANPEILTSITGGALNIRRGSAADTDNIITGQNNAGTDTFTLNGLGDVRALNIKKAKLDATVAPTTTDDSAAGYAVGSVWVDVTNDRSYVCVDSTASNAIWRQAGHLIEDEGTPLTQRNTINFTGAGVTVTDAGGKTVVTIAGGGGGGSASQNIGVTGAVVSGGATSGFLAATNNILEYEIQGGGAGAVKTLYYSFIVPDDYTSGAAIKVDSWTTDHINLTAWDISVYHAGVADATILNTDIIPSASSVYQTTTNTLGTAVSPGTVLMIRFDFNGVNGDNIRIRRITFNYNN